LYYTSSDYAMHIEYIFSNGTTCIFFHTTYSWNIKCLELSIHDVTCSCLSPYFLTCLFFSWIFKNLVSDWVLFFSITLPRFLLALQAVSWIPKILYICCLIYLSNLKFSFKSYFRYHLHIWYLYLDSSETSQI
jgi:hypothetical protein